MMKPTLLAATFAALLVSAHWSAPAFAEEEQPPAEEQTTGESGDGASDTPAGEEKPAE